MKYYAYKTVWKYAVILSKTRKGNGSFNLLIFTV